MENRGRAHKQTLNAATEITENRIDEEQFPLPTPLFHVAPLKMKNAQII